MTREWKERASVRMGWAVFLFAVGVVVYVLGAAGINIVLMALNGKG